METNVDLPKEVLDFCEIRHCDISLMQSGHGCVTILHYQIGNKKAILQYSAGTQEYITLRQIYMKTSQGENILEKRSTYSQFPFALKDYWQLRKTLQEKDKLD